MHKIDVRGSTLAFAGEAGDDQRRPTGAHQHLELVWRRGADPGDHHAWRQPRPLPSMATRRSTSRAHSRSARWHIPELMILMLFVHPSKQEGAPPVCPACSSLWSDWSPHTMTDRGSRVGPISNFWSLHSHHQIVSRSFVVSHVEAASLLLQKGTLKWSRCAQHTLSIS